MTNPITHLTSTIAQHPDDDLRDRSRALLNAAIDEAHQLLKGSPQMRLAVIKAIVPAIGRAAQGQVKSESEELDELRAQLEALSEAITGKTA